MVRALVFRRERYRTLSYLETSEWAVIGTLEPMTPRHCPVLLIFPKSYKLRHLTKPY
jgi:hypothetical protein